MLCKWVGRRTGTANGKPNTNKQLCRWIKLKWARQERRDRQTNRDDSRKWPTKTNYIELNIYLIILVQLCSMCSRMQMLRIEKHKINRKIKFNYKRGNLSGRITFFTCTYSSTIFTYLARAVVVVARQPLQLINKFAFVWKMTIIKSIYSQNLWKLSIKLNWISPYRVPYYT